MPCSRSAGLGLLLATNGEGKSDIGEEDHVTQPAIDRLAHPGGLEDASSSRAIEQCVRRGSTNGFTDTTSTHVVNGADPVNPANVMTYQGLCGGNGSGGEADEVTTLQGASRLAGS